MTNKRITEFKTYSEVDQKLKEIDEFFNRDIKDEVVENWLDSEYHRIFVTYVYPDVTKVN
jgi:hypothetical protein